MRGVVTSVPATAGLMCVLAMVAACGQGPARTAPPPTLDAEPAPLVQSRTSAPSSVEETAQPSPAEPVEASGSSGGALSVPVRPAVQVPDDIPAHMAWEGLGAGSSSEGCLDVAEAAAASSSAEIPLVGLPHGIAVLCYCNLTETVGDSVSGELFAPDGSISRVETGIELIGDQVCASFWHSFVEVPPRQVFTFTTQLSGLAIVDRFVPIAAEVVFEGWQANEPVRLVIYAPEADDRYGDKKFVADLRVTADAEGRLTLKMADPGEAMPYPTIFAIGQSSRCMTFDPGLYAMTGEIVPGCSTMNPDVKSPSGSLASVNWTFDDSGPQYLWEPCLGAPESRLRVGAHAVVKEGLSRIRVRAEPSPDAQIDGHIVPSEEVEILAGPACANNVVWWNIRSLKTGLTGWSMEGDAEEAWLEPE